MKKMIRPLLIRQFFIRMTALSIGIGIALIFSELMLRAASFIPLTSPIYRPDSDVGFLLKPYGNTDSEGFNDTRPQAPPANAEPILFVGDSFTFGTYPAPLVFPRLVEEKLRDKGMNVYAVNRGLPGAGPKNYVGLIDKYATALRPRLIVVSLFLGNDIEQSHPARRTRLWMGQLGNVIEPWHFSLQPEAFMTIMAMRKATRLIKNYWHLRNSSFALPAAAHEESRETYFFSEPVLFDIEHRHLENSRLPLSSFIAQSYGHLHQDLITDMRDAATRHGAEILFVLIPSEGQVNDAFFQAMINYQNEKAAHYDRETPSVNMGVILEKNGVGDRYLDLLPILRQHAGEPLYNIGDTHWNRHGNAIAAQAIAEKISSMRKN
jgi:hypothetical protein